MNRRLLRAYEVTGVSRRWVSRFLIVILGCVLGFGASPLSGQDLIFSDDFESGDTDNWSLTFPQEPSGDPAIVAQGAYPALTVDSTGDVHLVYARDGKLWYRLYDAANRTWSNESWTGIDQFASYRNQPRIAVDSSDHPHVLGGEGTGTGTYAYWDGADWSVFSDNFNRDTSLAIDSADNVYVIKRGGSFGGYLGARKRAAGEVGFSILPDPDTADGLPLGRNNHVYGSVFVSPTDDSIHVVYRHGAPSDCAYRFSANGGANWSGGGVSGDDDEAPSGVVGADGSIFVVSGNGVVHTRTGTPSSWSSLGRAVTARSRYLPNIVADGQVNLYVGSFEGRYNVLSDGDWTGERLLASTTGFDVGFLRLASRAGMDFAFAIWEEGTGVRPDNDNLSDDFELIFGAIDQQGQVSGPP